MGSSKKSGAKDERSPAVVAPKVRSAVEIYYRGVHRVADHDSLVRAFGRWRCGVSGHDGSPVKCREPGA